MPKVAFSKLNKVKSAPAETVSIADAEVTVAQYLPLAEKLDLIQAVIEQSGNGEEGFYNIVKLDTYYTIEMIRAYTNISFTEKQLEDIPKLYDAIILNGIWDVIVKAIPEKEQDYIWGNVLSMAREITDYNHSALGIMKVISSDYSNLNFDAAEIKNNIADPDNLKLLKTIVDKMG